MREIDARLPTVKRRRWVIGSLQNGAFLGAAIATLVIGRQLNRHFEFRGSVAVAAAFGLLNAVIYGILLHRPIVACAGLRPV